MSKVIDAIYNIRLLDDLAKGETPVHRIHPVVKIITTVVYLLMLMSFNKHDIGGLIPFVMYPMLLMILGEIPPWPIFKRLLFVEPLIIGIGILNPIFDPMGWVTFLSILIKSSLSVTTCLLLVSTTGLEKIAQGLRSLKIANIFVLQLILTFRYITVLIEELSKMLRAYKLRAPKQKGIKLKDSGSFTGQLLLRAFDRAQRVYDAMRLRGFKGEYHGYNKRKMEFKDILFLLLWCSFFILARIYNIPLMLGMLIGG